MSAVDDAQDLDDQKIFDQARRIKVLEDAIRTHRDQKADDRCWMDDQELYKVLGDGNLGDNQVGDPAAMLENCKRFIEKRCAGGGWITYQQMLDELKLIKGSAYVTHQKCGAIIETERQKGAIILTVFCPVCQHSCIAGELGEENEFYLVRKPQ